MKIAIIGAGIAGTAAAFEVARQGARAALFHDLTGSSGLYSGAVDFEPWDVADYERAVGGELLEFTTALGAWELGGQAWRVATLEGNVRPARGGDRAILDLAQCAGKRVAVVDVERDDWDAPLLAKSYAGSAWARQTRTEFFATPVAVLQKGFERRISGYDFAALHDAPERAAALESALRDCKVSADAWLFGPWLGIERALGKQLSDALGVPVGETTSMPGGAAGARFERARDRLLAQSADVTRARLMSVEKSARGYRLQLRDRAPEEFAAVVIASGGVAAGGVALERSFERRGGTGFRLSFSAPIALELDSEVVESVSSLANIDFVDRGLGALLDVGVGTEENGALHANPGLFAAGDVIAGRPRTALIAVDLGIRAARAALDYARRTS
ncbi:MAG TPA: FAD-dependent oxidoreductase [Polyangiaceae bacterium]|nr:FAD-dependent oxidoreductase [Polyangiaceae bacterium]